MRRLDGEVAATAVMLIGVLAVGLVTVPDYAITTDELLFDPYGRGAWHWYLSGLNDWPVFPEPEIAYYGPWFQMLTAGLQALGFGRPFDVRHGTTFVVGLVGLAALLPLGRMAIGRWAGFTAIALCLLTGNLYGHLFFSPNDTAFLAVMTWAMAAIVAATRGPSWPAVLAAGLLTGLAIATRPGGLIAQTYLIAAAVLAAAELILNAAPARALLALATRTVAALAAGWLLAIVAWPWLQAPHPFERFAVAFAHFTKIETDFLLHHSGREYSTMALPWSYVPTELFVRLPEGFLVLLAVAAAFAAVTVIRFTAAAIRRIRRDGASGMRAAILDLVGARAILLIAVAALTPPAIVIVKHSTLYDGIRHLLFIVPMLALLAAWSLARLAPIMRPFPVASASIIGAHAVATVALMMLLHPLEYVATNAFAGGVAGTYGRYDLDYWSAAATIAVRRLEQRLDAAEERFTDRMPRVHVCILWRETMVQPMFRRDWILELDPGKADFVIETERSHCAGRDTVLIDQVTRFGHAFAWTYANQRAAAETAADQHD